MEKYKQDITKRKARYWCFRFKTEKEGGPKATGSPRGFKKYVESLGGFGSWAKFAITWDIKGENPFIVVERQFSVWEEWQATLRKVVKPLPGLEEKVIKENE